MMDQIPHPLNGFQLDAVGYQYRGQKVAVLQDISLALAPSQFYAFVGPSGSGKSTLLRLLAGIDLPTLGTVRWGGREVASIAPRDRHFGIVFQDAPLFPERTVEAVVRFPLDCGRSARTASANESVHWALDVLGLLPLRNRNPATLSGGERQRAALARLLVWAPKVMLLDEPLSAVDHDRRPDLIRLLRHVQLESGATVVYITHDQIDVFASADQVVVLSSGAVRQIDSPEAVYREPASALVGRLVGDGPLNLVTGQLARTDTEWQVVTFASGLSIRGRLHFLSGRESLITSGHLRVGFRPEDVRLMNAPQLNGSTAKQSGLPSVVLSCCFVGSRYLVEISSCGGALFAWHHERLQRGDSTRYSIRSNRLPLFDPSGEHLIGTLESAVDDQA